jgi:hypothetical protein
MNVLSGFLGATIVLFTGAVLCAEQTNIDHHELRPPESFAQILDQKQRSVALFKEAAKVITNPRCVNCHPAGDRPSQGDDGHPHLPLVVRGPAGMGALTMQCTNCHGPASSAIQNLLSLVSWDTLAGA